MEHLPPHLENQLASSSCFTAYSLGETASTASSDSDNADPVDTGRLPSGRRSFLGHVHTYESASLKQTMGLAYYYSNQSVEIVIQGYKVDEAQASDIGCQASKLADTRQGHRPKFRTGELDIEYNKSTLALSVC